ncbi:DUF262 domain-containing protein [Flavobacterium oncorhynchi]|uniref:DUF262 domain-containing protein n=1 Tax=Flavobacterium oncorhynchi TaxID=728056 RepID=UPI00351A30B9
MEKNTLILLPVKDLSAKTFVIGGYQRGYKWGKKEILELMNDIHNYNPSKGLYCLQPLILRPIGDTTEEKIIDNTTYNLYKCNEVVDGQQRSTTLYLLLKYLHYKKWIRDEFLFELDFLTRERSGKFLKEKLHLIYGFSIDTITEKELIEKKYHDVKIVNKLWEGFNDQHSGFDNVDVYHFFVVTSYLIRWIDIYLSEESTRNEFIDKLLESVKVIWYSLNHSQRDDQVIQVFLNNNKGKIGLTSSELIKALFILDIKNCEPESISNLQINQFATEWDMVEKQLQDDSFWYFIQPSEDKYKEGTRIDYLFDLYLEKPTDSDAFFAYRHFETEFNNLNNITKSWDKLLQLYYKLLNWYHDSEIFHFVGFLTNSKIKSLYNLLLENGGKTREILKEDLKSIIKKHFNRKDKTEEGQEFYVYSLYNLDYKNYYPETLKVLLLYNIFYYLDNMAKHKFPFELFVKEKWSIEHIIPQNPKDIEEIDIYYQWFKDIVNYGELEGKTTILEKIKSYSSIEDLKKDKELKSELDKIITESEDVTHSLNNLLLLDRNTNSALGNKLFATKRNKILKFDKEGCNDKGKPVFIPIETLNAFNKTFSEEINIENWTKEDGDNYMTAIQERLENFIPKC